ncbi:hypothetical protein ACH5RR_028156 [Cinchona calisaya]|uniref:PHD-type domain-containing protein n=1 Tax=Cinchona calisaya TaxID=153742 RepID=A0ABD2YRJ3_9GENT
MGSNHDLNLEKERLLIDDFDDESCLVKFLSAAGPSEVVASAAENVGLSTSRKVGLGQNDGNGFESGSKVPESFCIEHHEQSGSGESKTYDLKDDDLLISAILKSKNFRPTSKISICRSKHSSTRKIQKGSCKLPFRSLKRGGGKCSNPCQRTVLSWLLHSGVLSLNEVIQYRDRKTDSVLKEGFVTCDGILCKCCDEVISISKFKSHASFRHKHPCLNLFMESGKPFSLCQLEAWSAEYKARKGAPRTVQIEEMDEYDNSCGCCGDGGDLLCCDSCPSTFHLECLYIQEMPEGNWHCPQCTCQICGSGVNQREALPSSNALKCSQCYNQYHEPCAEKQGIKIDMASDTWCCTMTCQQVYLGLQARIGLINLLSDGLHWTLLKCTDGNQKVHSAQSFLALKAECNLKLVVALKMMEEYFIRMVDPTTGVDMIPQLVYNWSSKFARVDYYGFYTAVLEKNDTVIALASIRIHGATVAEMPFATTCSKYRRQGMFRRLLHAIELMLKSLKVKMLVISSIPSTVETWKVGFGFADLEECDKRSLSKVKLMVVPGTEYLKKDLCEN